MSLETDPDTGHIKLHPASGEKQRFVYLSRYEIEDLRKGRYTKLPDMSFRS